MTKSVAEELRLAGVRNVDPFHDIGMPYPLRSIQTEGINSALRYNRFGLYFEPRLGKTVVFLLHAIYCAHYKIRTIILAPPITHSQIKEEWEAFPGNPYKLFLLHPSEADGGVVRTDLSLL